MAEAGCSVRSGIGGASPSSRSLAMVLYGCAAYQAVDEFGPG